MASAAEEITVDRKLSDIFTEGHNLYESVETSNKPFDNDEYQGDIKKCISLFEDATRLVSLIGMFSENEHVDEIATDHLKYLLLPFFLGSLTLKIKSRTRLECVEVAEVYYGDFIKRCEDYELVKRESTPTDSETTSHDEKEQLVQMAMKRNVKLEQFRRSKELREQLEILKVSMERADVDDEIRRNFFLKLLESSIIAVKDELPMLGMEKDILEMRKARGADQPRDSLASSNGGTHETDKRKPAVYRTEPLKPIIITRNDMQKAVYGMGYPSLPVMTVKEFYDQRVRDGIFPDPKKAASMKPITGEKTEEENEQERAEQDALEEMDDEQYLARRRAFDDYKDNVRRGDGNRHNRS